ncbi:MAG: UDP-2,3-diacylglucosamine diphosphatase [Phycisphaerae bacterium]|nr:UDP-2,3-diacylglucosamine diphosphatase [Phycisphaerae bacterium]
MELNYRSIFISDTHLGMNGVLAEQLAAFLKHVRCERLYLVGDIIDLWSLKARWRWPAAHNQVIRRILKMARKGVAVTYIPGNHDDALRQYAGLDFGGVRLAMRAIHRTADGRSLLVTHGDEFDLVVQNSRLLSMVGGWAYDHLVTINRAVNACRAGFGLRRWSFAAAIKSRVKSACTFVSNYEAALLGEAARRNLHGVVCGHVHKAALDDRPGGPVYANCGDWIERSTALIEHHDGRLELVCVETLLATAGIEVKRDLAEPVELGAGEDTEVVA